MKSIKYITAILLLSAFVIGCKKKNQEYTIVGRLMMDCETPAANIEKVSMRQDPSLGINDAMHIYFDTDENGYFEIKYLGGDGTNSDFKFNNGNLLSGIPKYKDLDLGNLIIGTREISYIRRLEVANSYTENDTLIFVDYNNAFSNPLPIKIAGPFVSGIIDTVKNWKFYVEPQYNRPISFETWYRFAGSTNNKYKSIDITNYCENFGSYYDVVFKIE